MNESKKRQKREGDAEPRRSVTPLGHRPVPADSFVAGITLRCKLRRGVQQSW